ncbi:hypothetical protein ACHWQZ_G013507 [Mnemiopsis leidyi]
MTVCQRENIQMGTDATTDSTVSVSRDLDELFYESVNLSEKLSRYVTDCQLYLQDEEFRRERERCEEVLDQQLPDIQPPSKAEETETTELEFLKIHTETTQPKDERAHEMTDAPDDDHVTEEMKLSSSSSASSLTDSEIELSDELTEVSSTADSISNPSDEETIDLEIDDFNFTDCSITRRVNPRPPPKTKTQPRKDMTLNEKTKQYLDQVDKKVSCKCCRSVMGRIVHEVRQSEKAVNIANLKPYRPRTSVITNVKEAVEFQMQYEREWYSAIMIQRAWRSYYHEKEI